tara:strand:- start:114 stop:410 length:297 start_codon:yes stop_codon:yes gene_type:complete
MKSFSTVSRELYEAKFKLPRRHKELKLDSIKAGGKNYSITYSQMGNEVYAFVNANETGPYNDLKDAEKSVKELSKLFKQMNFEGVTEEEIFNEINFRV